MQCERVRGWPGGGGRRLSEGGESRGVWGDWLKGVGGTLSPKVSVGSGLRKIRPAWKCVCASIRRAGKSGRRHVYIYTTTRTHLSKRDVEVAADVVGVRGVISIGQGYQPLRGVRDVPVVAKGGGAVALATPPLGLGNGEVELGEHWGGGRGDRQRGLCVSLCRWVR